MSVISAVSGTGVKWMKNKRIIRQPAETLMCTTSSEDKTFKFRRITWPDFPDGQAEWWQLQGDQVTMATAMKKLQQVQQVSPVRWPKVSGRKFVSTSFIDGRAVSKVRHPHAEAQFLANHPSQLERWNTCDACIRRRWRKVVTLNFLQNHDVACLTQLKSTETRKWRAASSWNFQFKYIGRAP